MPLTRKYFEFLRRRIYQDKKCIATVGVTLVLLELLSSCSTNASMAVITVSSETANVTALLKCEYQTNTGKFDYEAPLELQIAPRGIMSNFSLDPDPGVIRDPGQGGIWSFKIRGGVVISVPVNACEIVVMPPKTMDSPSWILLTSRLDCDFNTKIIHAQNSGYSALLIYDDVANSTEPMTMSSEYYDKYFIFSCFLGQYSGALLRNYTYENGYRVELTQEAEEVKWGHIVVLSLVIALLFMALACCFCMTWICLSVACWPRVTAFRDSLRIFARERRRSSRNELFATALKQVPTQKWCPSQLSESCAICMDEFQVDADMRVLTCNHGFHPECIDEWLVHGRRYCPLCGRKVILENHHLFSNTDSETEDDTAPLVSNSRSSNRTYGNDHDQDIHSSNPNPPSQSRARENASFRRDTPQAEEQSDEEVTPRGDNAV